MVNIPCCAQLCPTLWDPMDCSPPGSSVHGILWARILEWVAMPSSRILNLQLLWLLHYRQILTTEPQGKPKTYCIYIHFNIYLILKLNTLKSIHFNIHYSFGCYWIGFYTDDKKYWQLEENVSDSIFKTNIFYYFSFKLLDQFT